MVDELSRLRREFHTLTQRVEALEARTNTGAPDHSVEVPKTGSASGAGSVPSAADEGVFWALDGLQARRTGDSSAQEGAVMLVGSLTLPGGAPVAWQQAAGTAGLLETNWGDRAAVFGALAHPVRIELLRNMLNGTHATADLAAIDGLGTTGQLHHHLRQLVAAGWVRQSGRGSYEIPAARIVPLLACVVGVER